MALFGRNPYQTNQPKPKRAIKVGHPCQNCPHTHFDHGYYAPRPCYIDDCQCPGLKMDVQPIAPIESPPLNHP